MEPGITIVFTGPGKGKTSAALGTVLRALGRGLKVCIIQFIKHPGVVSGERNFFRQNLPAVELYTKGLGFVRRERGGPKHRRQARAALEFAASKIMSGAYDLMVLDELTYLISLQLVEEDDVLAVLKSKPQKLHLIITGRDASPALVRFADLVTECRQVKHPFETGRKAIKGIDY
jgi:cob(I)alamin adenosyltransferase